MAKINILTQQIFNRIAAGEVIDRPYSVVKELVENSIDSGANEIEIYVEGGGKQLIRVIDNGCGIEYSDLKSAYMPHATSKISNVQDLDNISTLGFRGEAVASIAAVSQMSITSQVEGELCYSLDCYGGHLGDIVESAGQNGTDIKVRNLFFNTPVRYKFLKSDRAEEADITNFISRFILSRPDVSFKYYLNNKLVLQSYGTNDEEALISVYGASILRNCYKIKAEKHGVKIEGYIGGQNFFKPNKSYQSVFLNGRYIINQTIAAAVTNAYSSYMMKRQYPFYVLYITVPSEIVDVNVHPNKADVRFADNKIIYGCIYNVISAVLDGNSNALEYLVNEKESVQEEISQPKVYQPKIVYEENLPVKEKSEEEPVCFKYTYEDAKKELELIKPKPSAPLPFEDVEESEPIIAPKAEPVKTSPKEREVFERKLDFRENKFEVNSPEKEIAESVKAEEKNEPEIDAFEENRRFLKELEEQKLLKQNKFDVSSFVFKGSLFNTYLIYEHGDDAYIIDQHAAHERLIFDRLKEQMEKRSIIQQPMLIPYVLDLNAYESNFLNEEIENIRAIGFEIDSFGQNSFKISALPVDLQDMNVAQFFDDILSDVSGLKAIKLDEILKDKLAMTACKAAIKGGMSLTDGEISKLFEMMNGDLGLKCPHGRPVVVKLSKSEIEKMFKRIV